MGLSTVEKRLIDILEISEGNLQDKVNEMMNLLHNYSEETREILQNVEIEDNRSEDFSWETYPSENKKVQDYGRYVMDKIDDESFINTLKKVNKTGLKKLKISEILATIYNPKKVYGFPIKFKNLYTLILNTDRGYDCLENLQFSKKSKLIGEIFSNEDFVPIISSMEENTTSIEYKVLLATLTLGFSDDELNKYIINYCNNRGFITDDTFLDRAYILRVNDKKLESGQDMAIKDKYIYRRSIASKTYFGIISQYNTLIYSISDSHPISDSHHLSEIVFKDTITAIKDRIYKFGIYLDNILKDLYGKDLESIVEANHEDVPTFYKNNLQCIDILKIVNKYLEFLREDIKTINQFELVTLTLSSKRREKLLYEINRKKELIDKLGDNPDNLSNYDLTRLVSYLKDSSDRNILQLINEIHYAYLNEYKASTGDKEYNRVEMNKEIIESIKNYDENYFGKLKEKCEMEFRILNNSGILEIDNRLDLGYCHHTMLKLEENNLLFYYNSMRRFFFDIVSYKTVFKIDENYLYSLCNKFPYHILFRKFSNRYFSNIRIFRVLKGEKDMDMAMDLGNKIVDASSNEMVGKTFI